MPFALISGSTRTNFVMHVRMVMLKKKISVLISVHYVIMLIVVMVTVSLTNQIIIVNVIICGRAIIV